MPATTERRISGIADRRQYVRSLVSRRNEDCRLCCKRRQYMHNLRESPQRTANCLHPRPGPHERTPHMIARLRSFTPMS